MPISPDFALILFTLGILLIYLELNRPGTILPGATGLLITLLAIATIFHQKLNPAALFLIASSAAIFFYGLRRPAHIFASIAATIFLIYGFLYLITDTDIHIHAPAAIACGLILGAGTSILTLIARRARTNKGLD